MTHSRSRKVFAALEKGGWIALLQGVLEDESSGSPRTNDAVSENAPTRQVYPYPAGFARLRPR